jgi:hypothetical protein
MDEFQKLNRTDSTTTGEQKISSIALTVRGKKAEYEPMDPSLFSS